MRDRGDAQGQQCPQALFQTFGKFVGSRLGREAINDLLPLSDHTIQTPVVIPLDHATLRLGRVLIHLRNGQRHAVRYGAVATGARENHRVLRCCAVEIGAQGTTAFSKFVLGPAVARDPGTGAEQFRLGPDGSLYRLDGLDTCHGYVVPGIALDVTVRIVKARHDRCALEGEGLRRREALGERRVTHGHHAAVVDGHDRGRGESFVDREYVCLRHEQVHRHRLRCPRRASAGHEQEANGRGERQPPEMTPLIWIHAAGPPMLCNAIWLGRTSRSASPGF